MNIPNGDGYYQGMPGQQQQQQFVPVYQQQPPNIYQQLGKPQPQIHMQGHPVYSQQQQQPQQTPPQLQSSGFQFTQPVQQQAPYALAQTAYLPSQTPYQPVQASYTPAQTGFVQQQISFNSQQGQMQQQQQQQQQAPYQTPYIPSHTPYQQQQQYAVQQQQIPQYQPQPPIQQQQSYLRSQQPKAQPPPQPAQISLSSSTSSNHSLSASTSGSSWRVSPKPPPVSPSASIAQQIPSRSPMPGQGQQQTPSQFYAQSQPQAQPPIAQQPSPSRAPQQPQSQFTPHPPVHSRPGSQGQPTAAQLAQMGQPPVPAPPPITASNSNPPAQPRSIPSPSQVQGNQLGGQQQFTPRSPAHARAGSQGQPTAAQLAQMGQPPPMASSISTPAAVRRPLPQPTGGPDAPSTGGRAPSVPPVRSQTLPAPTGSGIAKLGAGGMSPAVANAIAQLQRQTPGLAGQAPAPLPRIATNIPASSQARGGSASPTKRPLPLPASAGGAGTQAASSSNTPSTAAGTSANRRSIHGASAVVPSLGSPTKAVAAAGSGTVSVVSRTSLYAAGSAASTPASPQKRRASPPRFALGAGGSSLMKDAPGVETIWGAHVLRAAGVGPPETEEDLRRAEALAAAAAAPAPTDSKVSSASSSSASAIRPAPGTTSSSVSTSSSTASASNAPAKKFTPMWRRTIPEMPAPAWGYAAGMVAEPHPKPPPAPAAPPPPLTPKERKKLEKEEKERAKEEKKAAKRREKEARAAEKQLKKGKAPAVPPVQQQQQPQRPAQAPYAQGGMAPANAVQARYGGYQQQQMVPQKQQHHQQMAYQQQQAMQYGHARTPAAYRPAQAETEEYDDDESDEDDEEEDDEEEEEEEEEGEEEEEEEEEPVQHMRARQYTQPLRASSPVRSRYEDPSSPPKKTGGGAGTPVIRPKSVVDTSPIGVPKGRRRAGSDGAAMHAREREYEDEYDSAYGRARAKAKLSPNPNAKPAVRPKRDEERDRTPTKRRVVPRSESVGPPSHTRSRSAFEEREREREAPVRYRDEAEEAQVRGAPKRRPASAFAGVAASAPHRRRRTYEEEYEEDDSIHLAYDDEEEEEEEVDDDERWERTPRQRSATGPASSSSPSYGIRNLPPARNRRPAYNDEYEYEEEEEERPPPRRPMTVGAEHQRAHMVRGANGDDGWEAESRYRTGRAGLPQPPAMMRKGAGAGDRSSPEKPARGGSRIKSTPLIDEDEYAQQEERRYPGGDNVLAKFTAMKINGGGGGSAYARSDSRVSAASASAGGRSWPNDLPRLPRTPGSGSTPGVVQDDSRGYFDTRPQSVSSSANANPRVRPTVNAQNVNTTTPTFYNRGQPTTPNRTSLDLDDPPPRASIVRTPSPGPRGGYVLSPRRELPQPQGAPQDRGHPAEDKARVAADLQRRRSLYSVASNVSSREQVPEPSVQRRPQSQVFEPTSVQVQSGQGQRRPQSYHQPHQQHPPQPPQQQPHYAQQGNANNGHGPRGPFTSSRPQQTPAPPPTVGIESPHPIGGREKMADIPKLEEDSNEGSDTEHVSRRHANMSPVGVPIINIDAGPRPPSIPMINVNGSSNMSSNVPTINIHDGGGPMINVDPPMIRVDGGNGGTPRKQVFEIPGVSVSGPEFDDHHGGPSINVSGPEDHSHSGPHHGHNHGHRHGGQQQVQQPHRPQSQAQFTQPRTGGLICGGCGGAIIGRIVSAMGQRYHPACFKCTVCNELLEHVSSYEHEGRPYCHLDYHENFAPRCYSCKTAIIEEQFISLDDPALGKRAYHTQHFFCSECGDPFLTPSGGLPTDSKGELALSGDGEFEGFTVYKGYPYCEACHVRLRLPKCKRCKRSIRDSDQAVEALGGKWCWGCFVCAGCEQPFEDPSFFQRGEQPFCERCFSIILRNEV